MVFILPRYPFCSLLVEGAKCIFFDIFYLCQCVRVGSLGLANFQYCSNLLKWRSTFLLFFPTNVGKIFTRAAIHNSLWLRWSFSTISTSPIIATTLCSCFPWNCYSYCRCPRILSSPCQCKFSKWISTSRHLLLYLSRNLWDLLDCTSNFYKLLY